VTLSDGIALGAAIFAAFSVAASVAALTLQLRERISPQRAALYQLRLEATEACLRAIYDADMAIRICSLDGFSVRYERHVDYLDSPAYLEERQRYEDHQSKLQHAEHVLDNKHFDFSFFMPPNVMKHYLDLTIEVDRCRSTHDRFLTAHKNCDFEMEKRFADELPDICNATLRKCNSTYSVICDGIGLRVLSDQLEKSLASRASRPA
jgi:hypothetical protein